MAFHRPAPAAAPGRADPFGLARFGFIALPEAVMARSRRRVRRRRRHRRGSSCFADTVTASAWLRIAARMHVPAVGDRVAARASRVAPRTAMRWHAARHPSLPPSPGSAPARRLPEAAVMPLVLPARPEGRAAGAGPQFQPERKGANHEQYRRKEGLGVPAAQPRLQGGGGGRGGRAARGDVLMTV